MHGVGRYLKPIGFPIVFDLVDACGTIVHCTGKKLANLDEEKKALKHKEFIVSMCTRAEKHSKECGLRNPLHRL
jgi:hypothetical protein